MFLGVRQLGDSRNVLHSQLSHMFKVVSSTENLEQFVVPWELLGLWLAWHDSHDSAGSADGGL